MTDAAKHLAEIKELVAEQAEDEGLWLITEYVSEYYLQRALRQLHSVIKGDTPT